MRSQISEVHQLVHIAYRMALRWSAAPSDAEDIAQEAMLRYLTATPMPNEPVPWLYVVVRRLSNRSRLRNRARRDAEARYVASCNPERSTLDFYLELETVLSKLDERHRRVITLLAKGAQSHDIAAEFGVNVRDVGQMVARARKVARRIRDNCSDSG